MRSYIITSVLGIAALALTSGCYSCYTVTSPGRPEAIFWQDDIHIDARDKHALTVTLLLPATNSVSFAVLPSESTLTDEKHLHYRVEFEPVVAGASDTNESLRSRWYYVRAYGPIPSTSHRVFRKGTYHMAVAYIANEEHGAIQTSFVIERFQVPFFIIWFEWLIHGPP